MLDKVAVALDQIHRSNGDIPASPIDGPAEDAFIRSQVIGR